jgi:hypothetical protein
MKAINKLNGKNAELVKFIAIGRVCRASNVFERVKFVESKHSLIWG